MSVTLRKETNLYDTDAIADGIAGAISTYDASQDQTAIFNKLTDNGAAQGIFMHDGQLYINMSYLQTGTLKLGGLNNGNGEMIVYDENGNEIGRWNNDGLSATGNVVMSRLQRDYVRVDGTLRLYDFNGSCKVGDDTKLSFVYNASSQWARDSNLGLVLASKCDELNIYRYYKAIDMMRSAGSSEVSIAGAGISFAEVAFINTNIRGIPGDILDTTNPLNLDNYFTDGYVQHKKYLSVSSAGVQYVDRVETSLLNNVDLNYAELSCNHTRYKISYNGKTNAIGNSSIELGYAKVSIGAYKTGSTMRIGCSAGYSWSLKDSNHEGTIAIQSSSSKRYKHDISEHVNEELDARRLYDLKFKQFVFNEWHPLQYNDMRGRTIPGFIAEDVEEIYPAAVIHDPDGNVESWDERRIIPGMLKLIQEQHEEIENLKQRFA